MKTKLIYTSMTGHSKKIAKAVGEGLGIEAQDIKTNPSLGEVDLLFIVGGIYGGESKPELIEYVKGLEAKQIKKVVLLTSCTSKNNYQVTLRKVLEEKGIQVVEEEFMSQGSFLFMGLGHPNKTELQSAVEFARKYIK